MDSEGSRGESCDGFTSVLQPGFGVGRNRGERERASGGGAGFLEQVASPGEAGQVVHLHSLKIRIFAFQVFDRMSARE
jgi:hypothetical protein